MNLLKSTLLLPLSFLAQAALGQIEDKKGSFRVRQKKKKWGAELIKSRMALSSRKDQPQIDLVTFFLPTKA